jgi:hypothetical protein
MTTAMVWTPSSRRSGPGSAKAATTSPPWSPTPTTDPNTPRSATANGIATAGIPPSVGAVGSSYDNALAETINGLYKTEVIRHLGPWHNVDQVEHATAEWVDWFNTSRLFEYCGDIPRRAGELTLRSQAAANGGRVVKQPRPRTCRGDSVPVGVALPAPSMLASAIFRGGSGDRRPCTRREATGRPPARRRECLVPQRTTKCSRRIPGLALPIRGLQVGLRVQPTLRRDCSGETSNGLLARLANWRGKPRAERQVNLHRSAREFSNICTARTAFVPSSPLTGTGEPLSAALTKASISRRRVPALRCSSNDQL